jgi:hypothetical protein
MTSPAKRWADAYARAWLARDAETIVALYAESTVHVTAPVGEHGGRGPAAGGDPLHPRLP